MLPDSPLVGPEATYLGWLDCRTLDFHRESSARRRGATTELAGPARIFLDRARVALTSGHVFGSGGPGFVRINYATNAAILRKAVVRMATAIKHLPEAAPSRQRSRG